MQSLSAPLHRLVEDGAWFARASELRLWLVRCDENLRGTALRMVPQLEFHADNRSSWLLLADAHTAKDDGWRLRADRLISDWTARVSAFARDGVTQGAAQVAPEAVGVHAFALALRAVLAAQRAPLAGVVVVLAPGVVDRAEALYESLAALIKEDSLVAVRWMLVLDVDVPAPHALVRALGSARAQVSDCTVDKDEQRRDLKAMLAAPGPRFGTAFPAGVTPPRRVDDPPPLPADRRDEALRAAGVDPGLLEHGPALRRELLAAALAMSEGHGAQAVEHQRSACELCARLGLIEVGVVARITLASYLSALDRRDAARRELLTAIADARAGSWHRVESQAHLALGLLHNLDRKPELAVSAYADAARAAEAGDEPVLAIEGWRMAGQLAAQTRQMERAEASFAAALRVAGAVDSRVARGSSAAEAARQLATLYTQRGMTAQASSLHAQADALEREEVGDDARQ